MTDAPSEPQASLAELGDTFRVASASNRFAAKLYRRLIDGSADNLFFSPSSIVQALAMTYSGAAGTTAQELAAALGFQLSPERLTRALRRLQDETRTGGVEFRVANRLWGQVGYHYHAEFLHTMQESFRAGWAEADFKTDAEAARRQINFWVEEQTRGKLKDVVPPNVIDSMTRLVLASAIYFLGSWDEEFNEADTVDDFFTDARGTRYPVRMMKQSSGFRYAETPEYQMLELPYRGTQYDLRTVEIDGASVEQVVEARESGSDFVMILILPRRPDGLPELEARIDGDLLTGIGALRSCEVNVQLPRFRMESTSSLHDALKQLGIRAAFTRETADFSPISDDPDGLFLGSVLHRAFVEVNEKGTEAAAATIVFAVAGCATPEPEPPKNFRADRPFLFLIRDARSGLIHFLGRMTTPP